MLGGTIRELVSPARICVQESSVDLLLGAGRLVHSILGQLFFFGFFFFELKLENYF